MAPFESGSISFRLYPHDLGPEDAIAEMAAQAALAVTSGFDGIMVSERHGGIVGNVPNPLQVTGWLAREMPSGWVAPCPVLALLRRPAQIVEEVAWLAARYPGRVGVGLGTGGHSLDFAMYDLDDGDLARRFEPVLAYVASHLAGEGDDALADDFAVARCRQHPVPVLSAAMSTEAGRRAARCGAGIIGSSLVTLDRERAVSEAYRSAGGSGPEMLIRFVWLGEPPQSAIASKFGEYQRSSASSGRRISGAGEIIASTDPAEIAGQLLDAISATRRTCLHLRMHVPAVPPAAVRDQIEAVGSEVVPLVRKGWPAGRD
jgi:alkanesulfonate monooxygenase SsuD/methylene tetrahydromethanopterin reductase-like flavin-dependent oxidoreductase (luciferase family)